ncbi:unnamed protein product, partial [Prorocentrum cordatum]
ASAAGPPGAAVQVVDAGGARGRILVVAPGRRLAEGQVVFADRGLMVMRAGEHFEVAAGPGGGVLGLRHRNYGQAVVDGFYALAPPDRAAVRALFCPQRPSRYLESEFGETGARLEEKVQIPPEGSAAEAWAVLRAFNCNAQTIFHPQTGEIDTLAVYPLHAPTPRRMNHSCSPNVVNRFGGGGCLEVLALRPLGPGDELCHSYVDERALSLPVAQRRENCAAPGASSAAAAAARRRRRLRCAPPSAEVPRRRLAAAPAPCASRSGC